MVLPHHCFYPSILLPPLSQSVKTCFKNRFDHWPVEHSFVSGEKPFGKAGWHNFELLLISASLGNIWVTEKFRIMAYNQVFNWIKNVIPTWKSIILVPHSHLPVPHPWFSSTGNLKNTVTQGKWEPSLANFECWLSLNKQSR